MATSETRRQIMNQITGIIGSLQAAKRLLQEDFDRHISTAHAIINDEVACTSLLREDLENEALLLNINLTH